MGRVLDDGQEKSLMKSHLDLSCLFFGRLYSISLNNRYRPGPAIPAIQLMGVGFWFFRRLFLTSASANTQVTNAQYVDFSEWSRSQPAAKRRLGAL